MGIIENTKEIAKLIKKYDDQELYGKIIALREDILELKERNLTLGEELRLLREEVATHQQLVRIGNCYYKIGDKEHAEPFCMQCWDYEGKLVSLILNSYSGSTRIICNICNARKAEKST